MKPGAREGLCRKHLVTLKATTLKTLLEPDGSLPPVLPLGTYVHRKSDKTIQIIGGGVIQYFGWDEPEKIASYNLSGCAVDEMVELTEDDYNMLRGRCRMQIEGLENQIYAACNPGPPTHWAAVRFGLDGIHEPAPGCEAIKTKTDDNFYLPDNYIDDIRTFTGLARKRYYLGEWCGSEGLVYDAFDRAVFVRERRGPWTQIITGIDWGYTNPTAMLVVCQGEDGTLHVSDEFYKSGQLEDDILKQARRFRVEYGCSRCVCDPSAAALIETLKRGDVHALPGNNDVLAGIVRVAKFFTTDGAGNPQITISPRCRNLVDELGSYEWMPGKDKPKKSFDHACDALRYAVMGLSGEARAPAVWWVSMPRAGAAVDDDDDEGPEWLSADDLERERYRARAWR